MHSLDYIQRHNAEAGLQELRKKFVGQWVEANPTGDVEATVQGTVQEVMIHNNRYEYQLAGRVGHFIHPQAVEAPPLTVV